MPNQSLKTTRFVIPDKIKEEMLATYNANKGKGETDRILFLLRNKSISYDEIRRLKNYFDTTKDDKDSIEYALNGGIKLKNWVNASLGQARSGVYNPKKVQSDVGMPNKFIKPHAKDKNKNPSKVTMPVIATKAGDIFNNVNIYKESKLRGLIIEAINDVMLLLNRMHIIRHKLINRKIDDVQALQAIRDNLKILTK